MTEQYNDPTDDLPLWKGYAFAIIFGLFFGWTLVARAPDFNGPSVRGFAIAFLSMLWWVGIFWLAIVVIGGVSL